MDYVYAIIRDADNPKSLRIIQEYIQTPSSASDYELCRYFNYASSLSDAYSSELYAVNASVLKNNYVMRNLRLRALGIENTIKSMKEKYDVVAISHRYGGFTHFDWNFGENISFHIYSNFGFGSVSDFNSTFKYKEVILAPYSYYVKYKYSDYASVTRCTYSYGLEYSEWDKVMNDSLSFYNAIVYQDEAYVFDWLRNQLEEMVSTLERFLVVDGSAIFEEGSNKPINRVSSHAFVSGEDFWVIKSQKIANCLEFVRNIEVLPVQVNSRIYIERLCALSSRFVPLLKTKIMEQQRSVEKIQSEFDECCDDEDYTLYKKIYDKYWYKRYWYSCSKFKICWPLLHMLKHVNPSYRLSEIRSHFQPLKLRIERAEEISRRLSGAKHFLGILETNLKVLEERIAKVNKEGE